jgi:hypothetical protein
MPSTSYVPTLLRTSSPTSRGPLAPKRLCYIFSIQEEDILEHIDGECHLCTLWLICRSLCKIGMHLITLLNILTGKILVSTLECQVPWGDTYDEIVNHHLAYALK